MCELSGKWFRTLPKDPIVAAQPVIATAFGVVATRVLSTSTRTVVGQKQTNQDTDDQMAGAFLALLIPDRRGKNCCDASWPRRSDARRPLLTTAWIVIHREVVEIARLLIIVSADMTYAYIRT